MYTSTMAKSHLLGSECRFRIRSSREHGTVNHARTHLATTSECDNLLRSARYLPAPSPTTCRHSSCRRTTTSLKGDRDGDVEGAEEEEEEQGGRRGGKQGRVGNQGRARASSVGGVVSVGGAGGGGTQVKGEGGKRKRLRLTAAEKARQKAYRGRRIKDTVDLVETLVSCLCVASRA